MSKLFPDTGNYINNELGLSTGTGVEEVTVDKPGLMPWTGNSDLINPEAFWKPIKIEGSRWNKLYPYRLLVVDVSKPGKPKIVSSNSNNATRSTSTVLSSERGSTGLEYVISQQVLSGGWEITLPITPQQLKIVDQFSINTVATMRGIVEEHNGVKFKIISASGTTGIWPLKPTQGGKIASPTSIGPIFGGTLEATGAALGGIDNIASAFSGKHPNKASTPQKPEQTAYGEFSTGYYQALYLGQFLERYAQAKKNPDYKGWRLVFDIPKQNQSFIVTPVAFEMAQSEQKPNQIMFSFQLKAWKRINLQDDKTPGGELPKLETEQFQRIVNTISATRRALGKAKNLVAAVRSDSAAIFNILRQGSLAVKDLTGVVISTADLPDQIIQDANSAIQESLVNLQGDFPPTLGSQASANDGTVLSDPQSASSGNAGDVIKYSNELQKINEGLSAEQVAAGDLGADAAARQDTNPLNNVFASPETNFDLFNSISVDGLNLNVRQRLAIEEELDRVRLLTINDFRDFRQELVRLARDIADNFGAGNQTYANIYGFPDPKSRPIPMTDEENEILQSIFESVQAFDLLTATKQYDDFSITNALDFVGGLANESGIDFQIASSKLLVPVPFGLTIEEISGRYLNDSSKWLEIVTLNKLRSPYIDETGYVYPMLSNAEGRQFNVNDSQKNLFVGQKITILSNTQPPISRKIVSVEKIGDENYLVTVDGLDDLDVFKTSDKARMQGYLPGTVNSQNQIYIPVDAPSDPDDRTFSVANVPDTSLNKLAKIDWLLTENFDVAINSVGDFRFASGLTNLIQALKMKIKTQKGSLLKHLDYGIGITHGISVADIENGAIIKSLNAMIASDNRFQSVDSIKIRLVGATMTIDMVVKIANGTGILPITFDVRAS